MPDGLEDFLKKKKSSSNDDSVPRVVDDELAKLGWSDNARLSLLGDLGRENGWNRNTIFKGHTDPGNGANNRGVISWQGDRQTKLNDYLKKQGVYGRGDDEELRGMTRFMEEEMRTTPEWQGIHKAVRNPNLSTYDASENLRKYIKYVPNGPYNSPDPNFRVKNNAEWAGKAKNIGLGGDQLGSFLKEKQPDELEQFLGQRQQPQQPKQTPADVMAGKTPPQPGLPPVNPTGVTFNPNLSQPQLEQPQVSVNIDDLDKQIKDLTDIGLASAHGLRVEDYQKRRDAHSQSKGGKVPAAPELQQQPVQQEQIPSTPATDEDIARADAQKENERLAIQEELDRGRTSQAAPTGDDNDLLALAQTAAANQPHTTVENEFEKLKAARDNSLVETIPVTSTDGKAAAREALTKIAPKYGIDVEKVLAENPDLTIVANNGKVDLTYGDLARLGVDANAYRQDQAAQQRITQNQGRSTVLNPLTDPLMEKARANVMANPLGGGTDADIQAEYDRLKRTELSDEETKNAQSLGETLKRSDQLSAAPGVLS